MYPLSPNSPRVQAAQNLSRVPCALQQDDWNSSSSGSSSSVAESIYLHSWPGLCFNAELGILHHQQLLISASCAPPGTQRDSGGSQTAQLQFHHQVKPRFTTISLQRCFLNRDHWILPSSTDEVYISLTFYTYFAFCGYVYFLRK